MTSLPFPKSFLHDPVEKRFYKGFESFFSGAPVDKSKPLYYIYRNVRLPAHTPLFTEQGLRYDITIISPGRFTNGEAVRTVGHLHKPKNGKRPNELYQVLSGNALFYLQHSAKKQARVVAGKTGAVVRIPGDWAHSTVNASRTKPLVIANIFTSAKHPSDYSFFKKTHGPAFFPVWKGNEIIFEKNPRTRGYKLLKTDAKKAPSLYNQFIRNPKKFRFLK
jgi:oxalate decarboxylase/phosphoglucose isomerase-like protein (cupin superfamily)